VLPPEEHELSLEIDGTNFRFWGEYELNLGIDSQSCVSFTAPFDPENAEHRQLFRPFTYQSCRILLAGKPLFTGYLLDKVPRREADKTVVAVTAYARTKVLDDCPLPPDSPHEFSGLTLLQIAQKLCEPFGLTPKLGPGVTEGSKFGKVVLKPDEKVLKSLEELALQRGLIIGSDEDGDPIFRTSAPGVGVTVASLTEAQPVISVTGQFTPQDFYSSVTLVGTTKHGRKGSKYTEPNPFLTQVVRPFVALLDDTDAGDLHLATQARIARMLGNSASWDVELATWFTPDGDLWMPDMRLLLEAPGAFVFRTTELLVRSVRLKKDTEGTRTATLNLILPGAFSSELPSELPWSE